LFSAPRRNIRRPAIWQSIAHRWNEPELWRKLPEFCTGALVKATIVNGEILVENGEHTGAFSGRALGNGKNGQASALG